MSRGSLDRLDMYVNTATMMFFITTHAVSPYLSQVAVDYGASEIMVSLLGTFYAVAAVGLRPVSGVLNDRGYTAYLLVLGSLFSLLAQSIYMFSDRVETIYLGRFVQGVGIALFIPTSLYIASVGPSEEAVSKRIATRSFMISLAATIGPMIGASLVYSGSWRMLFTGSIATATATLLLSLVYMTRSLHDDRDVETLARTSRRDLYLREVVRPGFLSLMLANFLFSSGYAVMTILLPAYHRKTGVEPGVIAVFFTISSATNMLTRMLYIRAIGPGVLTRYAVAGLAAMTASLALVSIEPSGGPLLYTAAVLTGVGMGLTVPSLQSMALTALPREVRGLGSSLYTVMFDVANMVGPPLAVCLAGSYLGALEVSPLFTLAAASVLVSVKRSSQRPLDTTSLRK